MKLRLFVTYTIIQSITSSEICSLHLTHPSAHTLAVGSRRSGAWGAVEGSGLAQGSHLSWTITAGPEIQTHNLGLVQLVQVQCSIH